MPAIHLKELRRLTLQHTARRPLVKLQHAHILGDAAPTAQDTPLTAGDRFRRKRHPQDS